MSYADKLTVKDSQAQGYLLKWHLWHISMLAFWRQVNSLELNQD